MIILNWTQEVQLRTTRMEMVLDQLDENVTYFVSIRAETAAGLGKCPQGRIMLIFLSNLYRTRKDGGSDNRIQSGCPWGAQGPTSLDSGTGGCASPVAKWAIRQWANHWPFGPGKTGWHWLNNNHGSCNGLFPKGATQLISPFSPYF
jgi:hypothetical protein